MAHCIYIPTIKDKLGKEINSKLFTDLVEHTGNREAAKTFWGLALIKTFTDLFSDLKLDENGEVTLESLDKAINIADLMNEETKLLSEKKLLEAVDRNNEPILYNSSREVIDRVISFNQNNDNLVASINRVNNLVAIDVAYKNKDNFKIPNEIGMSNSLNNGLLAIMKQLGFDVKMDENLTYDGIFDPLNATETAEGLLSVIKITKGELGLNAFPEEFSHFAIEGLLDSPIVSRLVDSLNNEAVLREVLGEQYDEYLGKYDGDQYMMQKEAAGKMLAMHLKGEYVASRKSLALRASDFMMGKFGNISESSVQNAIRVAHEGFELLAESITDGSILPLFNKNNIMDSQPLYKLSKDIKNELWIAEEAERISAKKLNVETGRTNLRVHDPIALKALLNLRDLNEKKKYTSSILNFIQDTLGLLDRVHQNIKLINEAEVLPSTDNLARIGRMSTLLRSVLDYYEGYSPIINEIMAMEAKLERGEVKLTPEDAKLVSQKASEVKLLLNTLNNNYKSMRFDTLMSFLRPIFGEDKFVEIGLNKGDLRSLEMIVTMGKHDIDGIDKFIMPMSGVNEELLTLVDRVFKLTEAEKDKVLQDVLAKSRNAEALLLAANESNTFIYERNSKGELTDRVISDIDYERYNADLQAVKDKYRPLALSKKITWNEYNATIVNWEKNNKENIVLDRDTERVEDRPKKSLYGKNTLSKLNPALKKYYDTVMGIKETLDAFLPVGHTSLHNSIHVRATSVENLMQHSSSPAKISKLWFDRFKDSFLERVDQLDFGQKLDLDGNIIDPSKIKKGDSRNVQTDFAGKQVLNVPVFFTRPLESKDATSTDFTGSLLAYATMAINYSEMTKIADTMELLKAHYAEREVIQKSGKKRLQDSIRVTGKTYSLEYTKPGVKTQGYDLLDSYLTSNLYGQRKKHQGSFALFGLESEVNTAKLLDQLRAYTTHVGLGLNVFSGIGNITMGRTQMFLDALGGEYYNLKDSKIAQAEYWKLLPEAMNELNSITKESKLNLMHDSFNALETFSGNMSRQDYFKNPVYRIMGKGSFMFMAEAGEHYIRSRNMLAHLQGYKVLDTDGKKIPIYDAFSVKKSKEGKTKLSGELQLKKGLKKLDGSAFTEADYTNLRLRIMKTSKGITVNVNPQDMAYLLRDMWGRLLMLFRGWMPGHYGRRLKHTYYDNQLQQDVEGFYRTAGKFAMELAKDLIKFKWAYATHKSLLNAHEIANLKKASAEISLFFALAGFVSLFGGWKDKESAWVEKMIIYQAHRLKLQVSASTVHPDIVRNMWKILQTPMPAMNGTSTITDLLWLPDMFKTIESGHNEGENKYLMKLYKATPYLPQVNKAIDLHNEKYMFNIFTSKKY